MELTMFTGGCVATNGYLLQIENQNLLFDAPEGIFSWLEQQNVVPDALFLTHQHFDHVEDAHLFQCPIYAHSAYNPELILDKGAREWGLPVKVPPFSVTERLVPNQKFTLGQMELQISHIPGHSPDSLAFYVPKQELALVGDTLFQQGIGRTDLPQGNHQQLCEGIKKHLLTLPPETTLYPGHGPSTTPLEEQANPFLT